MPALCVSCGLEVRPRQQAIECDSCNLWQHRTCDSGISLQQYREALKLRIELVFVCKECVLRIPSKEPTVETSVEAAIDMDGTADGTTESTLDVSAFGDFTMNVSDINSTATTTTVEDIHEEADGIDVRYGDFTMNVSGLNSTTATTSSDITDVNHESLPLAETTSLGLDDSFDIANRDIEDPAEIIERSLIEPGLSETIIEDESVTFSIFEKGSKRGGRLLVSSDGYTYGQKKVYAASTLWTCNVRSKAMRCHASVRQVRDDFHVGSHDHVHPADPGVMKKTAVKCQVKEAAMAHVFRSASEIVEEAMLEHITPTDVGLFKPSLVSRAANRIRAKTRPSEPKDLTFTVDTDFLQCEDFLVDDIHVDTARHFIFSTQHQLQLLGRAKRWFMDGTFKRGQMMSIHAFIQKDDCKKQIPLVFILMSRRQTQDYVAVLSKLKEVLTDIEYIHQRRRHHQWKLSK